MVSSIPMYANDFKTDLFDTEMRSSMYYHSGPEWTWEVMAMKTYFILPKAPELEPYHHLQFTVTLKTSPFYRGHSQRILISADWAHSFLS